MHILYATDGSEGARAALEVVKLLPLRRAELHLITVVPDRHDTTACGVLDSAQAALGDMDFRVSRAIVHGHPAEEILRAADEQPPDLLVLGSRGAGAVARFFLGSVAERVARHAPCPVLVARPPIGSLDRVLIGVDGSACAAYAADWVLRCPLPEGCEFDLVTIVPPREYTRAVSHPLVSRALRAELRALVEHEHLEARESLAQLAASFAAVGKNAVPVVRPEHPALGLLSAAEERLIDLIAVGSHGATAFDRFLLGSVSEHVLHHARCSVLIVKARHNSV